MSGKGFQLDTNFRLNKCATRCAGMDRISELPDEIISHILSFLPFKEAVATSILSRRWSSSWKYTPNLVFVDDPCEGRLDWRLERSLKNTEWVNSVLNSYKAPSLKQFTISFYVHPKTYHHVSEWLHFAFSRRVESLKLNFQRAQSVLDINILSGIPSGEFKHLKELTLERLYMSGEALEFLLRNCSQLERLIMKAALTSDLVIGGGTLKYLEIWPFTYCDKIIKVSAPNLTRLLRCNHHYTKLFFVNVPSLVEASFFLYGADQTVHSFANTAARLDILTICLGHPKVFSVPKMPKLKKLVLDYAYVTKHNPYPVPVARLLQASPYLEEFKVEISDIHMYFFGNLINKAIFKIPKHGRFQHGHLKVFEFSGFCHRAADNVALVRYIVNNCVALKEIIITPIGPAVARQFLRRREKLDPFLYEVDAIAEEAYTLHMKKCTEQLLAGKIPDHIKLTIV